MTRYRRRLGHKSVESQGDKGHDPFPNLPSSHLVLGSTCGDPSAMSAVLQGFHHKGLNQSPGLSAFRDKTNKLQSLKPVAGAKTARD